MKSEEQVLRALREAYINLRDDDVSTIASAVRLLLEDRMRELDDNSSLLDMI